MSTVTVHWDGALVTQGEPSWNPSTGQSINHWGHVSNGRETQPGRVRPRPQSRPRRPLGRPRPGPVWPARRQRPPPSPAFSVRVIPADPGPQALRVAQGGRGLEEEWKRNLVNQQTPVARSHVPSAGASEKRQPGCGALPEPPWGQATDKQGLASPWKGIPAPRSVALKPLCSQNSRGGPPGSST